MKRVAVNETPTELGTKQFADLEEPADAITIDVARSPEEIVSEIRKLLALA